MLSSTAKEKLERELFLSKGGGIYYDGARVEADPNSATLFVGLGGTGADMLIRIKNEVKRRMILPQNQNGRITADTPRNIGFLAFDTAMNTQSKTWGIAAFDQFGSEYCSLAVNGMPSVIAKHKQDAVQGDPVWKWYDKIDPVAGLDGAGGVRQIGRLMLFENIENVWKAIETKIRTIKGDLNKLNIIVCTGIAGGTGSGTFLDMAYILREIASDLNVSKLRVLGYIVLPDVNILNGGEAGKLFSNGFACLKELDYWMCPGDDEQKVRFNQQYSVRRDVNAITSRPFDYCHLLSAQDMNGSDLDYDSVISSMAENVFAFIANEVSTGTSGTSALTELYDNIDSYMTDFLATAPLPACYRYLAVGTEKIEIPYEEISTLLAARLFENLAPTLALRPEKTTFEEDMKRIQLIPNRLVHNALLENTEDMPLNENHDYKYDSIWSDENIGARNNRAYRDVYQWIVRTQAVVATKNAPNFPDVKNGLFQQFAKDIIKDLSRGPCYLAHFVKSNTEYSVIPRLDAMAKHCDGVAATCASEEAGLERELEEAYRAGPTNNPLKRGRVTTVYLAALKAWADNDIAIFVYTHRAKVFRELRDRFQIYYDRVLLKLSDVLEALPGIFAKNLEYIGLKHKEAERLGKLDTSKLIWPQDFEREHSAEFQRLLVGSRVTFLEDLSKNLSTWVGADLDDLASNDSSNSDIPGFISRFVSKSFGELLQIDMEKIIERSKLSGNLSLDDYIRTEFIRLREDSIPMYSLRSAYQSSTANFGIVSVPDGCQKIHAVSSQYRENKEYIKKSRENTRYYFVKIVSGISLHSYSKIESMEREYETRMSQTITSKGIHLNGEWYEKFPSPLHQGAWTADVYTNKRISTYNDSVRAAFDICLNEGIVTSEAGLYVLLGLSTPFDWSTVHFSGDSTKDLEEIKYIKDKLWGVANTVRIPLSGIGRYKNEDGNSPLANIKESILRLPRICDELIRQSSLLDSFKKKKNEIEDPLVFADALICGLIAKQGFEIILKQSASSVIGEPLLDTSKSPPFAEFDAYKRFHLLMTDERREDIDIKKTELLRRISSGGENEKTQVIERVTKTIEKYTAVLPVVEERIQEVSLDRRDSLRETIYFYNTVIRICRELQRQLS